MAKRPQPQPPQRPQSQQPRSKEEAIARMIQQDPQRAAEILKEILKNK